MGCIGGRNKRQVCTKIDLMCNSSAKWEDDYGPVSSGKVCTSGDKCNSADGFRDEFPDDTVALGPETTGKVVVF